MNLLTASKQIKLIERSTFIKKLTLHVTAFLLFLAIIAALCLKVGIKPANVMNAARDATKEKA